MVVRDGEMIATGVNLVTATNDPTAHAEVMAIRDACKALGRLSADGCKVYTSCEPCPMCLAAIYWSRCEAIFYGNTAADAAAAGFDDSFLYEEVKQPLERAQDSHGAIAAATRRSRVLTRGAPGRKDRILK